MNQRGVSRYLRISILIAISIILITSFTLANNASQAALDIPRQSPSIWGYLFDAAIFGLSGIIFLIIGYYIWEAITISYSVKKELVEKQNQAVALVTASFIIGMAIIIAAALFVTK
jgi:amino acid transporter